ncbi:MAG: inositol monophosphatase, partial [Pirellulaceae bacterium]|nr:inositol monophosphatase [Pirellulaceae bacterium]
MSLSAPAEPATQARLDLAVSSARAAGAVTLQWFRQAALAVERKGDGSPVTAADRAAESL